MMEVTSSSGKGPFVSGGDGKSEQWQKCIDRANIMMKTIDKKSYSFKIVNKEFQAKKLDLQRKLNKSKGDVTMLSAQSSNNLGKNLIQQQNQNQTMMSEEDTILDSVSSFTLNNITFKDLIDYVNRIETNYQTISQFDYQNTQ